MTHHPLPPSPWSTACGGHSAGTSAQEQSALGAHFGACQRLRGRLFGLHCLAERTHGVLAARFITTLVVLAAALALATTLF